MRSVGKNEECIHVTVYRDYLFRDKKSRNIYIYINILIITKTSMKDHCPCSARSLATKYDTLILENNRCVSMGEMRMCGFDLLYSFPQLHIRSRISLCA